MTERVLCTERECGAAATMRVAWPGRGWVLYCERHAHNAVGILELLGSVTASEPLPLEPSPREEEGTR